MPVASVPIIVARGMVTRGVSTLSVATLADSNPSNAHNVKIAEPLTAAKDKPSAGKGVTATGSARPNATGIRMMTATSGTSLINSVASWNRPAARAPRQLIAVTSQISAIVDSARCWLNVGTKMLRKLTDATASVTFAVHTETQ